MNRGTEYRDSIHWIEHTRILFVALLEFRCRICADFGESMTRIFRAVGVLLVVGLAVVVSALGLEQWRVHREDARLLPPGKRVDVGGYRLHLDCRGEGSPIILLEGGLGLSASAWAWIQLQLAERSRVCTYDRAGYGWSEGGPSARSADRLVEDLHNLLGVAGEEPPFVLVGHSLGGLLVRAFHGAHPEEVAGLVLLDPTLSLYRESTVPAAEIDPAGSWNWPILRARLGLNRLDDALAWKIHEGVVRRG
jgi:hypothetical protein